MTDENDNGSGSRVDGQHPGSSVPLVSDKPLRESNEGGKQAAFKPDELVSVNDCYLVTLVLVVSLTSAGFGIALVGTDELSNTYTMHMNWTEEQQEDNITWLTCASALGLMTGSLAASTIVQIGRRKAILFSNIVALIGALL